MSNEERAELGARLRQAREYLGLSQVDVAKLMNLSRTAITQMENGKRGVDALELLALAKLYRCTAGSLTGDENPADADGEALLRATSGLSPNDRRDILKFAEFLRNKKGPGDDS